MAYAHAFFVTFCCLLRYSDCGCGPAYKFVTLDADPHHKSQRPETCTVRYHGNYCALHAFEIELHWIAATGCIVNDMVRKLKSLQVTLLKCVDESSMDRTIFNLVYSGMWEARWPHG